MRQEMSIWFFSGVLLFAYGVVILFEAVRELYRPLANPPALSNLHAGIWWGGFLALAGLGYVVKYFPRRG